MDKNVCEVMLEVLADAGVKYIFSIPGEGINEIVEAIRKQDRIKMILVRHEETGAFSASAIAKLTGGLGVCMGTSGPGAIHLLNGLYDAKHDHASVLAITGQVETRYQGTEMQQEVDLHQLFEDVSIYNQVIQTSEQMPRLVEEACKAAINKKGVAHLVLPINVAKENVPEPKRKSKFLTSTPRLMPPIEELERAAQLLNGSKKVAILAGIGAKNASLELLHLAELLKAPIIKALRGKDILPDNHPYLLGGIGLLGTRPAVKAINNCDCLLMAGTDFPYEEFYPEDTPAIQIDIFADQIGKRYPVEVGLVGDAAPTLAALSGLLIKNEDTSFLEELQDDMKNWKEKMEKEEKSDAVPIRPQALAASISELADDNAIFCCDTGNVTVWSARNIHIRGNQLFTLSGGLASMAFGLPAAIGAKLAFPDRQVIALVGDGGFTMLMGDFLTAVQYNLPIVIVIFNNHKLGMIQMEQEVKGYPEFKTKMHNPDFSQFAMICGGEGEKVTQPERLEGAITKALQSGKPYILDVEVNPEELAMPPEINLKQAMGYARAKVLESFGKGDS